MNCAACGRPMAVDARFCSGCGKSVVAEPFVAGGGWQQQAYQPGYQQGPLMRARYGRKIAGVCLGVAKYYGWDVTIVRLAVVLVALFGCGTPLLAYAVAWLVMPEEPYSVPVQPVAVPVQPTTEAGGSATL